MIKNIKLTTLGCLLVCIGGFSAAAQSPEIGSKDPNKKETQEIVIRKKGEKDTKFTIEISNDKVLVNGKPLAEFNENGITINNRKILIRDGNGIKLELNGAQNEIEKGMREFEERLNSMRPEDIEEIRILNGEGNKTLRKPYVFLGVATENSTEGAKIRSVVDDSPAKKAGLQKDDIITKINDKKIIGSAELSETIKALKVKDKIKIYFQRDGKTMDTKATLSETKVEVGRSMNISSKDGTVKTFTMPAPAFPREPFGHENNWERSFNGDFFATNPPKLGLKIQDTDEGNSVKILAVEEGSASAIAGLQKDDLITEIAGVKVQNTDDARVQLQQNKEKSSYTLKAKRNNNEMNFTIKIPKKLKTANL